MILITCKYHRLFLSMNKNLIIQNCLKNGFNFQEISQICMCSMTTISKVKKYLEINQIPPDRQKSGRKTLISFELSTAVETLTLSNPKSSDSDIVFLLNQNYNIKVSRSTVNKIRHQIGFKWRPQKIIQALNENQIEKRIKFGNFILDNHISGSDIFFSDESRICLSNDSKCVWMKKNASNIESFIEKVKFPKGVMIWGCVGVDFKSKLIIIENAVNSFEYQNILEKSGIFNQLNDLKGISNYYFQQDGATCHVSKSTLDFINEKCKILEFWPPNSPDLSPIELIWGILKNYVKKCNPKSKDELVKYILTGWNLIDQNSINNIVKSFEFRIELMLKKNGESIMEEIRHGLFNQKKSLQNLKFSFEENLLIEEKYQIFGPKWDLISKFFINRNPESIKNQYKEFVSKKLPSIELFLNKIQ